MKLTFSTLGCPGWPWREIFATAKDLGMNGIEIRGIGKELFAPSTKPFLPENIDATMAELKKAGLEIPMLTSNADLGSNNTDENMAEAKAYIDLAQKINTPFVRVMCQNAPGVEGSVDLEQVTRQYRELCDYAKDKGVTPLIETNSVLGDSAVMAAFIKEVGRENSGVLWDVHHPYRYFGEAPEKTAANLKGMVKHVHVKDSVMRDGKTQYRMMGYGDVPVLDALKQLSAQGYEGYISLEWVKRWSPDLQEPGIVFSHFASYMQYLFRQI